MHSISIALKFLYVIILFLIFIKGIDLFIASMLLLYKTYKDLCKQLNMLD